jgi:hypothetical protein
MLAVQEGGDEVEMNVSRGRNCVSAANSDQKCQKKLWRPPILNVRTINRE